MVCVPRALLRAALVRFRRSATRLERIEELEGPTFLLGSEATCCISGRLTEGMQRHYSTVSSDEQRQALARSST
jgi:hypothetical protein